MYIDQIALNNFRTYKGENTIDLSINDGKNVSIISGNNGYGKTSFLTSLVWCLYGKLMGEVDERYRKEIYDSGGYKNYCRSLINHRLVFENADEVQKLKIELKNSNELDKKQINDRLDVLNTFSVRIRLKKIFIPVIPCNTLEVHRCYNIISHAETLTILIDGYENELTKHVGPEIFINDFILRKEIAKFFFFDAEKIVELAEISSVEDRRNLSRSYGEVLGIKKYLDLKDNLENLRVRLRKRSSTLIDKERLEKLNKQSEQNQRIIEHKRQDLKDETNELLAKRIKSDNLQEQLIREGSSLTVDELKDFKIMKDHLQEENGKLKNKMREMMDVVPLAIASSKVEEVRRQLEAEQDNRDKKSCKELLRRKTSALKKAINNVQLQLTEQGKHQLFDVIDQTLLPEISVNVKTLLDFSLEQENRFFAIYDNIQNSFTRSFRSITSELKKQQTSLSIINRKLADAESKENDPVIKTIRHTKTLIDCEIKNLEQRCIDQKAELIALENSQKNIFLQISELNKRISVENIDRAKDETAERLIGQLNAFISKLKHRKKQSLEEKILKELNVLLHKQQLVEKVEVVIEGDLIDINLYDHRNVKIEKSSLSKGEQQLYATALLKALVEESHIRFPVFIDSPLQKFDKAHAKNIIQDFYPNVSAQVILLPLLEKELNEVEFSLLFQKISDCYLIEHRGEYQSGFRKVAAQDLFSSYKKQSENVYRN